MWLGSRLRTKSIKRDLDGDSAREMHDRLLKKNIPIENFNLIAEQIQQRLAKTKRQRMYSKRRVKRRLCEKTGRTCFDLLLFLLFCVMGAVLYHLIEYPLEVELVTEFDETAEILEEVANATDLLAEQGSERAFGREIRNIKRMENNTDFSKSDARVEDPNTMSERLELIVDEALESDAAPEEEGPLRWEYDTAFFWALTVVTTIGYGQFNPVTTAGRLFVIPYGFVGLLVGGYVLLMVANTIQLFLEVIFGKILPVEAIIHGTDPRRDDGETLAHAIVRQRIYAWRTFYICGIYLCVYLTISTVVFWKLGEDETWGMTEALYWSFVTISSIGFGDYVPDDRWLVCATLFILFGIGIFNKFVGAIIELCMASPLEFSDTKLTVPTLHILDWVYDELFDEVDDTVEHLGLGMYDEPILGSAKDELLLGEGDMRQPLIKKS